MTENSQWSHIFGHFHSWEIASGPDRKYVYAGI
jgi:hypothetical protein